MKKIRIIALHLAYGGVEKAICNLANMFVSTYDVEIICMYQMPDSPAYFLDERVYVRYLMKQVPNKKEFMESVHNKQPLRILKEGIKSTQILHEKKKQIKKLAQSIHDGIVIITRNEDTVVFNRYMDNNVYSIAQLHHDHKFDDKLIKDFQNEYNNIDVFALLCPQLCSEVEEIMNAHNTHTKCVVIPNFIEELPKQAANRRKPILLAVGRLHQVKGFDRLLKMMPQLIEFYPEWQLHIIGDGEEEMTLKALANSLHVEDHVVFLGQKNSSEIEIAMKEASIFLMTSYSEGFPFVLLEAMSCSLPVVAFDVRVGPRAIIHDQENGYLIEDGQIEQFIATCHTLMKDHTTCALLGANAYESVRQFSKEKVAKIWFDLIEKGKF